MARLEGFEPPFATPITCRTFVAPVGYNRKLVGVFIPYFVILTHQDIMYTTILENVEDGGRIELHGLSPTRRFPSGPPHHQGSPSIILLVVSAVVLRGWSGDQRPKP